MAKKIIIGVLSLILLVLIVVLFGVNRYLGGFAREAGLSKKEVLNQLIAGFKNPYQKEYLTVLVLGLDQRPEENSLLTDTILLAVINTQTGNYLLFSIPRDLWLDDLKTKINALYYYGQKENPDDGTQLVKERLEQILDWRIDYTVLLGMDQIKDLIDLVGGVEVEVERGFVDHYFPKDDGSGEVMTIEFQPGRQVFDGERALQFMRSRKSEDPIEGTDDARQKRQKKVILALKDKLVNSKKMFSDPEQTGELYRFLLEEVRTQPKIKLKDLVSFWRIGLKAIKGKEREVEIPWRGEEAVLKPARDPLYQTWILVPIGDNWQRLRDFFQKSIPQ